LKGEIKPEKDFLIVEKFSKVISICNRQKYIQTLKTILNKLIQSKLMIEISFCKIRITIY